MKLLKDYEIPVPEVYFDPNDDPDYWMKIRDDIGVDFYIREYVKVRYRPCILCI